MSENHDKTVKLEQDARLVAAIDDGDEDAWALFVERFTGWSLYKSREWCFKHCSYSAADYFCGLQSLQLQREGKTPYGGDRYECDEGLDTYIWIFEQLKRRVRKYSGKNQCLLSTYVWTLLNSREMYIDWLRWRYGRAF
jgi:hypothetical protein